MNTHPLIVFDVLVHGAWADGSSWAKVIAPLSADGFKVLAPPLPLTSFLDDSAALERVSGPIVLAGHAYAGAVIGATRNEKVKARVYVAARAPDEGETVLSREASSDGAQIGARPTRTDLSAGRSIRSGLRPERIR